MVVIMMIKTGQNFVKDWNTEDIKIFVYQDLTLRP